MKLDPTPTYLGIVSTVQVTKSEKEELQVGVPQWHSRFVINLITLCEELKLHITNFDQINLILNALNMLTGFLWQWPKW